MPRTLTVLALVTILSAAAAGCGGGEDSKRKADSAPTPVSPPPGFVTESGQGWSFVRPDGWVREDIQAGEGEEAVAYGSLPGAGGMKSYLGMGTELNYQEPLKTAVEVSRGINSARYSEFEIQEEGPVDVAGAEVYKIDATFNAVPQNIPFRFINLYIQTPKKKQMNLFVRAPVEDFDRAGLERVIDSLRLG